MHKFIRNIFSFLKKKTSDKLAAESREVLSIFISTVEKLNTLNSEYQVTVKENQSIIDEKTLENTLINKTMSDNINIVKKIENILN